MFSSVNHGPIDHHLSVLSLNCTSRRSSMTLPHAEGSGMGLCYGSLAVGPLLGGRWVIALFFYPFRHLTLKRNGDAL